jgi:hypothetical protein
MAKHILKRKGGGIGIVLQSVPIPVEIGKCTDSTEVLLVP